MHHYIAGYEPHKAHSVLHSFRVYRELGEGLE